MLQVSLNESSQQSQQQGQRSIPLGLIEGFYGRAWSWAERARVIRSLAPHGYRSHLYAPKADATLRAHWRAPLPDDWCEQVRTHQSVCAAENVRFGLGVSPEGFDQDSKADWQRFESLIAELNAFELDSLALLFDDPADRKPLSANTQAYLVDLAGTLTNASQLFVCPTWYSNDRVLEQIYGEPPKDYLRQLAKGIDPSVSIFWAGEQICASGFVAHELERVADKLGRLPTLWDNYPVNDGPHMSGYLHLREPRDRKPEVLANRIQAHFINPALQPTLTLIPLACFKRIISWRSLKGKPPVGEDQRLRLRCAKRHVSKALAHQLWHDLSLCLQDTGLHEAWCKKPSLSPALQRISRTGGSGNFAVARRVLGGSRSSRRHTTGSLSAAAVADKAEPTWVLILFFWL